MATSDLVTEAQVDALSAAVATAVNAGKAATGTLGSLTTTDKSSIVAAVNEVKASIGSAGATINDTTPSLTSVYSSTKTDAQIAAATAALVASAPGTLNTLDELAAALGDDASFATSTATALGNRVRYDAAQTLTAPQKAQALTNLGVARSVSDFAAAFAAAVA